MSPRYGRISVNGWGGKLMADKIRLGIIGANIHRGWAPRAHLPAIVASPEFELTAVCTTRQESAEESRAKFGAKMAFDDWYKMLDHPDIDAVAIVLRVPSHYEPTMAALNAGKHVYTEWPLGRNTAEAEEMADLARTKGVLERTSDRSWQRDKEMGANTLTITCGHTIDALRFVVGDFSQVSAVVSTQAEEWLEVDTGQRVGVTSPDNILVSGRLTNGGVASVHVASNPWAGSGYQMEIHGRDGTLVVTSEE